MALRTVYLTFFFEIISCRKDSPHIHKVVNPYDWTFTPRDYRGTLHGAVLKVAPASAASDAIDYALLRLPEQILFYDEVILYEDELDDNGCAKLSAKIVSTVNILYSPQKIF